MTTAPSSDVSSGFGQLDLIASPVFVLKPDASGEPRYVAFNANARAASGRPLGDYIGKTAKDIYHGAYGRTAFERHCEVLQSGQAMTYQLELPLRNETASIRTTLLPCYADDGSVTYLYGTSVDLTNEQHTREAEVSFKTVATEMEQFVAMAAHDLRAPLRNMSMIAEMLSEGFVDHGDGKAELIEMLEEVAEKSMMLIADVLNHARAVDSTEQTSTFNFAALCRDICDVLDPLGQHSFTYSTVELTSNRTALQIAIRNVLENAIKHGNREQLQVDISVQPEPNNMLGVTLTDTGRGFPDAALEFLNGGEFRVDSGYGLLGVRRMVQARGGTMTSYNLENGQGAVVHFTIPGTWVGTTNSIGDTLPDWDITPSDAPAKLG